MTASLLPECSSTVIKSIIDTLLNVKDLSPPSRKIFPYEKYSDMPLVADKVIAAINHNLAYAEVLETGLLFSALNTAVGTSALAMSVHFKSFPLLPVEVRTNILSSLRDSTIELRRKVFQGLKRLILGCLLSYSEYDGKFLLFESTYYKCFRSFYM